MPHAPVQARTVQWGMLACRNGTRIPRMMEIRADIFYLGGGSRDFGKSPEMSRDDGMG